MNELSHERRLEVADRLHTVAIHLLRRVRAADVEMGLTPERASLLSVLVFGGARTPSQLAVAEQVTPPAITRIVNGLEREGLVRREQVERDRRLVLVRATRRGERILRAGRRRRVSVLTELVADTTADELETLERAASILARALERNGSSQ